MTNLNEWLANKSQQDHQLYERYGKPLEKDHTGEYIAITSEGKTILGKSDVEILKKAIETFGSGNFAFLRLGHRTFGRWLSLGR